MPLQNRVSPRGEIIFSSSRGTLMGNRGRLHDRNKQIIRQSDSTAWIICLLQFKDYRRPELMSPNSYTELFFLDEATALAAGHRPCAMCQRYRYKAFKTAWHQGQGMPEAGVGQMDRQLHAERMTADGGKLTHTELIDTLPDGTFIDQGGDSHLLCQGKLLRWSPEGYLDAQHAPSDGVVQVLTPKSIVAALRQGYTPTLHHSAQALLGM